MPFSSWSPSCVLRSRCGSTSFLGRFLPELRLSPLTDAKMWTNVPAEGDSISRILGMVNIGERLTPKVRQLVENTRKTTLDRMHHWETKPMAATGRLSCVLAALLRLGHGVRSTTMIAGSRMKRRLHAPHEG